MDEIKAAYNKLTKNRFYRDEMRPYLLTEVREYALQISMRKLDIWDKFCQVESNVKQALPVAKKAGYDNILSYYLSRDEEYVQAEAVINLIDNKDAVVTVEAKPHITINHKALIMVYNRNTMQKDGSKLYIRYGYYSKKLNRIAAEEGKLKNNNKVELFTEVIESLSGEAKTWAERELRELKKSIDNQDFIK